MLVIYKENKFNVLSCRLKSTNTYYQFNIKTQIKHKNPTNTHKNTKKKQRKYGYKTQ